MVQEQQTTPSKEESLVQEQTTASEEEPLVLRQSEASPLRVEPSETVDFGNAESLVDITSSQDPEPKPEPEPKKRLLKFTKFVYKNCLLVSCVLCLPLTVIVCYLVGLERGNDAYGRISTQMCSNKCSELIRNVTFSSGKVYCDDDKVSFVCDYHDPQVNLSFLNCASHNATLLRMQLNCLPSCSAPEHPKYGTTICNNTRYIVGTLCFVKCDSETENSRSTVRCQKDLTWSKGPICQPPKTVVILAGGESRGEVTDKVEVFPNNLNLKGYSECLPALPQRLKWGNMGLLGEPPNEGLIVCGGELNEEQERSCWILDGQDRAWRRHSILTSLRSQSANAVSADHAYLYIISGYAGDFYDVEKVHQGALSSMQRVGREDTMKEQKLNFSSAARFASAIALHSGKILVTGGLNRGKEVYLVNGPHYNYSWTQRKEMLYPRAGHAIAKLDIDEEECVIVAGGYDLNRKFHTSVEYYMVNKDKWIRLPYDLPYPRAFFLLQVTTCPISIYH